MDYQKYKEEISTHSKDIISSSCDLTFYAVPGFKNAFIIYRDVEREVDCDNYLEYESEGYLEPIHHSKLRPISAFIVEGKVYFPRNNNKFNQETFVLTRNSREKQYALSRLAESVWSGIPIFHLPYHKFGDVPYSSLPIHHRNFLVSCKNELAEIYSAVPLTMYHVINNNLAYMHENETSITTQNHLYYGLLVAIKTQEPTANVKASILKSMFLELYKVNTNV